MTPKLLQCGLVLCPERLLPRIVVVSAVRACPIIPAETLRPPAIASPAPPYWHVSLMLDGAAAAAAAVPAAAAALLQGRPLQGRPLRAATVVRADRMYLAIVVATLAAMPIARRKHCLRGRWQLMHQPRGGCCCCCCCCSRGLVDGDLRGGSGRRGLVRMGYISHPP